MPSSIGARGARRSILRLGQRRCLCLANLHHAACPLAVHSASSLVCRPSDRVDDRGGRVYLSLFALRHDRLWVSESTRYVIQITWITPLIYVLPYENTRFIIKIKHPYPR